MLLETTRRIRAADTRNPPEPCERSPTVNLGTFEGGDVINTVPSSAEAGLDVRVLPSVDSAPIVSQLRDCLGDRNAATLVGAACKRGSHTEPGSAIVRAVTALVDNVVPRPVSRRFATGTGTAPSVDEYTIIDKLRRKVLVYARLPFGIDRMRID